MTILDFNQCILPCDCGWNVTLAGRSKEELNALREFVAEHNWSDHTNYKIKANSEEFIPVK